MRILLAPMEGVVDHHMRNIMARVGGIDGAVTEFVRVTDHVLPEKVFKRYCPELLDKNRLLPVKIQLLGSNPHALAANACKAAALGSPGIDLNFGCPAKTVNKNRGGACLLDETSLLYEIVCRVRESLPAHVPLSVKIRLGYEDRESYLANAIAIEKAGATELVVHARSKSDGYAPPAYWHYLADIKKETRLKLVANGDIWTPQDYELCKEQSLCEDIMLGRSLLARPDLAQAIRARRGEREYAPMRWAEVAQLLADFFDTTCRLYPSKYCGNRVKQWLHYLRREYWQAEALFQKIKRGKEEEFLRQEIRNSTHMEMAWSLNA